MPSLNDEHTAGYRPRPGDRAPERTTNPSNAMTITRHPTVASSPTGTAETIAQQSLSAIKAVRDAQLEWNRQLESEQQFYTQDGLRAQQARFAESPVAKVVDAAEQAVVDREAQARAKFDTLMSGLTRPGDAAQEQRNGRFLNRVERQLAAADSPAKRISVARELMASADRAQLGVLAEELPSMFADGNDAWIEETLKQVDPEIGAAATEVKKAAQAHQIVGYAARSMREGFQKGSPPTQLDRLDITKYDPDAM